MKKNVFNWMLTAVVVCGLSLSFTACSDDDGEKGKTDEQEQTVMPQGASDDATVLAALLKSWVEDFDDEATSAILSKSYEATVGESDAAQQTVRTMVVGSQTAADEYAHQVLSIVGASAGSVAGFQYSNAAFGTVKYQHGSGNDLGVFDISIRQLPGFTKLRLLKDYEGNVGAPAYYQKGDIVKYTKDNKYYICLQDHEGGANATWVSFDCGEDVKSLKTSTCSWFGAGDDIYFKGDMAKPQNVYTWLKEFVLSDEGYSEVLGHLMERNLPLTAINQIVPSSSKLRNDLVNMITVTDKTAVLDVNSIVGDDLNHNLRANQYWEHRDAGSGSKLVRTFYPFGLLLAGPARWSMGFPFDYWVPNVVLVHQSNSQAFRGLLDDTESQYSDPGHFKYELWGANVKFGQSYYDVYTIATHWTHEAFKYDQTTYKCLLNFVQNRRTLEGKAVNLSLEDDLDWTLHNITSRELSVKDNGEKYKYFETVYRGKEGNANIQQVKPGYLLCSNGKCYMNKTLATVAGTIPVGMVVYMGEAGSVESGTQYNALAMALENASFIDNVNDKETLFQWRDYNVKGVCTSTVGEHNLEQPIDGLAMTRKLRSNAGCAEHNHCIVTRWPVSYPVPGNNNFSEWFIPAIGQWILAIKGMGYELDLGHIVGNGSFKWAQAGVPEAKLPGGSYFTTSQDEEQNDVLYGMMISGTTGNPTGFDGILLYEGAHPFRPFVAFTVNQ